MALQMLQPLPPQNSRPRARSTVVANRIKWTATPANGRQAKAPKEENPAELAAERRGGTGGATRLPQLFPETAQWLSEEPPSVGKPAHHWNVFQYVTQPRAANLPRHLQARNLVLVPRVWRLLPLQAMMVVRIP